MDSHLRLLFPVTVVQVVLPQIHQRLSESSLEVTHNPHFISTNKDDLTDNARRVRKIHVLKHFLNSKNYSKFRVCFGKFPWKWKNRVQQRMLNQKASSKRMCARLHLCTDSCRRWQETFPHVQGNKWYMLCVGGYTQCKACPSLDSHILLVFIHAIYGYC